MVSLTPQISMMAMIAPAGVLSGIARYAPISPSRSFTLMFCVFIALPLSLSLRATRLNSLRELRNGSESAETRSRKRSNPSSLAHAYVVEIASSLRSSQMMRGGSQPHQLARVAGKNPRPLRIGNFQRVHRRDRLANEPAALLGAERRVGREQAVRGLEERVPAAGRRDLAVERRVGIEHLVVRPWMLLEPGLLGSRV